MTPIQLDEFLRLIGQPIPPEWQRRTLLEMMNCPNRISLIVEAGRALEPKTQRSPQPSLGPRSE